MPLTATTAKATATATATWTTSRRTEAGRGVLDRGATRVCHSAARRVRPRPGRPTAGQPAAPRRSRGPSRRRRRREPSPGQARISRHGCHSYRWSRCPSRPNRCRSRCRESSEPLPESSPEPLPPSRRRAPASGCRSGHRRGRRRAPGCGCRSGHRRGRRRAPGSGCRSGHHHGRHRAPESGCRSGHRHGRHRARRSGTGSGWRSGWRRARASAGGRGSHGQRGVVAHLDGLGAAGRPDRQLVAEGRVVRQAGDGRGGRQAGGGQRGRGEQEQAVHGWISRQVECRCSCQDHFSSPAWYARHRTMGLVPPAARRPAPSARHAVPGHPTSPRAPHPLPISETYELPLKSESNIATVRYGQ